MGMIFVGILIACMVIYLRRNLGTYDRPTRSVKRTR